MKKVHKTHPSDLNKDQLVEQINALQERINSLEKSMVAQRKSEDALKKSEKILTTILNNNADGIVIVNKSGKVLYVNPAAENLFGRSREDFLGFPLGVTISANKKVDSLTIMKGNELREVEFCVSGITWQKQPAQQLSVRDITEHKKTIAELVKLRKAIDSSGEAIFMTDRNGIFTFVNPGFTATYGYVAAEVVGKVTPRILTSGLMSADSHKLFWETSLSGQEVKVALKNKRKDGTVIDIEGSANEILDEDRNIIGFLGIKRDITERKRAEEALRESESSLRNAQEIAKMGSWEWDMVTQKTNWSDNYFAIHGFKSTDIEPSFELFKSKIHPDDVHILDGNFDAIMKDKTPSHLELRLIQPDGTYKWIQNNISPVIEDDKLVKLRGIIIDITDRKQMEIDLAESLQFNTQIINSIDEGIIAFDSNLRILVWNPFMEKLSGFPASRVLGTYAIELFPFLGDTGVIESLKGALKGKSNDAIDVPFNLPESGESGWAINRNMPFRNVKGEIIGVIGTVYDITERKQAEKDIKILNESLEQKVIERTAQYEAASKAKSEFLANMSHEIRTPMNSVLGYAELLMPLIHDKNQKNYLQAIKSSGTSLLTLINDILDLSKIEAGKLELQFEYIDTQLFFGEIENIFSLKIAEKELNFILDISSSTPAAIYVDEIRLRQVLINLLGNAVKFTEKGLVRLAVWTENPQILEHKDRKIEEYIDLYIEVEDTGIGISREFQERIFGAFQQQDGQSTKKYGGTGLGLAITRKLVELMRGNISVSSELNKGSKFTVVIPDVAFLRDFEVKERELYIDPDNVIFQKATILIADDVEHNRKLIIDGLRNTVLNIIEAENGEVAFKLAKEIMPDLIIADIRMPVMDGFELLERLKKDKKLKHIPVIAYSASVMKSQKEEVMKSDFAGLLIKPIHISDLLLELINNLPHQIIQEEITPEAVAEETIPDKIKNLPKLLDELETGLYKTWESFSKRQPINEVREFGEKIYALGEIHHVTILIQYGKDLIDATDDFNIKETLNLLRKYPDLIEKLKKN